MKLTITKAIRGIVLPLVAFVALANSANATSMCVASDTVAIVLDPSIQGTSYTNTGTGGTWTTTFPYGVVSGISTCNDTSGSYGVAYPQYDFNQGTTGVKCWCRMLHPARSAWLFHNTYSSASDCASYCANSCGYYVRGNAPFRRGVFGSAGN